MNSLRSYATGRQHAVLSRSPVTGRLVTAAVAIVAAGVAGNAIADEGGRLAAAISVAGVALLGSIAFVVLRSRVKSGVLGVEIPVFLLLASTIVFRQRTADALATNPLDPAAQFRVFCVALAGLLGVISILSGSLSSSDRAQRLTTPPFRLYALYVAVALLGIASSVKPLLTAYRGVELIAALIVMLGAMRAAGSDAAARLASVMYWFIVLMVTSVWIGVATATPQAVEHITSGTTRTTWTWVIQGVFPTIASNGVGFFGAVLAVWSLGRATSSPWRSARWRNMTYFLAALGVVTVVFAQYRTGYVALVLAIGVFLVVRRKMILLSLLAFAVVTVFLWSPSFVTSAQPFVLRGQTPTETRGLSGRVDYWKHALPVWKESPWVGKGLITATRFEVLAPLGLTQTAAIHSTWVEALVGTGIFGLVLLGTAFLLVAARSVSDLWRRGNITALLLVIVFAVHSITGNSFEALDWTTPVFLWLALTCGRHRIYADGDAAECAS